MGQSIADIPTHFIRADQRLHFLAWVASIPCNESAKRGLLSAWSAATHTALTIDDYRIAIPKS